MLNQSKRNFKKLKALSIVISLFVLISIVILELYLYKISIIAFGAVGGAAVISILLLGRTWCGFCCPFGIVLDAITQCAAKLHIPQLHITEKWRKYLKVFQILFLITFIVCQVILNFPIGILFAVIIIFTAPFIPRFFCNLCPIGLVISLVSRFSPVKLKKNGALCTGCRACYEACPMGCKKVLEADNTEELDTTNCILCGKCIEHCPEDDALALTAFNKTIHFSQVPVPKSVTPEKPLQNEEKPLNISNSDTIDPLQARTRERFINKNRITTSKYLQKLDLLPGAPEELNEFTHILRRIYVENDPVCYKDDKYFVGVFCTSVPLEIIYAAGARPIRLCCGTQAGVIVGDGIVPRDACPLVKSIAGHCISKSGDYFDACGMCVVPVTCDCKKKLASTLNTPDKPAIPLYIPLNRTDDNTISIYVDRLKSLANTISEKTGVPVTRKSLEESISLVNHARFEIHRLMAFKMLDKPVIRGSHIMAVMNSSAYEDIQVWTKKLKELNDALDKRVTDGKFITNKKLPRILLTGAPVVFPNYKIPLLIEEQGGLLVVDDTCLGDRALNTMCMPAEDTLNGYYHALANTVGACTCPVFSDNKLRERHILQLIKDNHIDGIVYHVLRGCVSNDYDRFMIESIAEKQGIPVICLESDYSDEDVEQLRIRMEAFLEMIKFKERKKRYE